MRVKLNVKLLFFILAILFLILAIITIRGTYARYVTALTAEGSAELGKWLITVNEQNIIENSNLSNTIVPVFNKPDEDSENSEYIAEGKIAPGSVGYVIITLDYSKVTVPFKYDMSFSATPALEDFDFASYSIDSGEDITVTDPNLIITGTILPDETTRTRTLKLNFAWKEGTGETLNDVADTLFTINNENIGMRFNFEFTQLLPQSTTT